MPVPMHPINNSTDIDYIGWNSNKLYIKFNNDDVYEYNEFTFDNFQNFLNSKEIDQYYNENIKNKYTGIKIN